MKYELKSDLKKKSITVTSFEEAKALKDLCKQRYGRDIFIIPDVTPQEFDEQLYSEHKDRHMRLNGSVHSVDLIILGMNVANFDAVNYRDLLEPLLLENSHLVKQYKEGNLNAINAIMGKFLKANKGYDASVIKTELITLLTN